MLARTTSYTTLGLHAVAVDVEVDAARGLPTFSIIGLPDQAVKEAKERIRAAILNSQYQLPSSRLTINLAPADVKKEGGIFDLAMALGMLAATGQADPHRVASLMAMGELALDGSVRAVPGVLPIALALRHNRRPLMVPRANAQEARLIGGLHVVPVASLTEAVAWLSAPSAAAPAPSASRRALRAPARYPVDFADVRGQAHVKRALEVAVAGGHHALLIGPPGSGKTMLAQRMATIEPDLSLDEALEATAIHSVAGLLHEAPLIAQRPFRAPHHTTSAVALVGGGATPKPGEVSLAHHGVLFLDELPEFHRDALESLRQPLEDGVISVARAKRSVTFPARFLLVAAMNPCPCGYLTDPRRRCRCPSHKVAQYLAKISGPLLDRIDLHVEVPAVRFETLTHPADGESSQAIKARVVAARRRARKRLRPLGVACNAQLRHRDLANACPLSLQAAALLKSALQELGVSARSYGKLLKIARTIADLAASEEILPEHLAEAIQYRSLDRQLW
ncbi:MAG: YifB family Mg chelatase-like AAA ATPase [Candidatus Omnitrophica bacterium]|nr:YifB family Mg chelatase-like AAA ATPase [Candidatus Omnitrophota bacterium]